MSDEMGKNKDICVKVMDHIYLGSIATLEKREIIGEHGLNVAINCAAEITLDPASFEGTDLEILKFGIYNDEYSTILEIIDNLVETLDNLRSENKNIYICCPTALCRAPAVVIYYVMLKFDCGYDEAYYMLEDMIKEVGYADQLEISDNLVSELRSISTGY